MIELSALTIESVFGCVPACAADNLSILTDLLGRAKAGSIVQATGFASEDTTSVSATESTTSSTVDTEVTVAYLKHIRGCTATRALCTTVPAPAII